MRSECWISWRPWSPGLLARFPLSGKITTGPMAQLPLVLIPAYFVPIFVMLHLAAFFQARRLAAQLREQAQSGAADYALSSHVNSVGERANSRGNS